jgi:hypothetical protein
MYYVVNDAGQIEGPFPADWVRSNAKPGTQVSYQQRWIPYSSHPDFQQQAAPAPKAVNALASKSDAQLFRESFKLLGIGVACCTLLLLAHQALIRQGSLSMQNMLNVLKMAMIWVLVLGVLILPAYALGRLFGGRARFSEVFFAFGRTIAVLYIIIPFSLLLYGGWFENLRQSNIVLALLVIFSFMFIVPVICVVFAFIGIKIFVNSMAFTERWQAWATVISATIVTTIACLLMGDWFQWFKAIMSK